MADGHRPGVLATEQARLTGQSDRAGWRSGFVRYSPGEASRRPRFVLCDPSRARHAQGERKTKKSDIAAHVADKTKVSKWDAEAAVNAFLGVITDGLARGESVNIAGFGTFTVKHRPARQGRNPRTGEPIEIAASSVPSFKAGKGLRDAVSQLLHAPWCACPSASLLPLPAAAARPGPRMRSATTSPPSVPRLGVL